MSKKQLTILVIIVVVLVAIGGVVWYTKQENQPVISPVTENEPEQNDSQLQEQATTTESVATTTAEIDTSDWQTYRNEEYKYEMKYPKEWGIVENNAKDSFVDGRKIKNVIFNSPDKKYYLLFGTKKKDENIYIEGRTGFPAQDIIKKEKEISIHNVPVDVLFSRYKGKINEIYYSKLNSQKKPYEYFELNNNLLSHATFGSYDDDNFDLKDVKETKIADEILMSFKFIN